MADDSYTKRGGRFVARTQPPITTYGKVDDMRSIQGFAARRTEIYEEHVALPAVINAESATRQGFVILEPQRKTDGVVNKKETIVEPVYVPSASSYTYDNAANREVIEDYATADGRQGKHHSARPDQTSNKSGNTRSSWPGGTTSGISANTGTVLGSKPGAGPNTNDGGAATGNKPIIGGVNNTGNAERTNYTGAADPVKESPRAPQVTLAGQSQFPRSSVQPVGTTIDSNEAARRYKGYLASHAPRPETIDSNEAARRYDGVVLPPNGGATKGIANGRRPKNSR